MLHQRNQKHHVDSYKILELKSIQNLKEIVVGIDNTTGREK